jgi:hypothetical protein
MVVAMVAMEEVMVVVEVMAVVEVMVVAAGLNCGGQTIVGQRLIQHQSNEPLNSRKRFA